MIILGIGLAGAACTPRVAMPPVGKEASPTPVVATGANSATAKVSPVSDSSRTKPFSEDRPVAIDSDRLSYTQQGQVTVFQGHVRVQQETTRLDAPYLEVRSQDGQAVARQGIRLVDHTRGITVTAQEMEYKENLSHAQVRGKVKVYSHDDQNQALLVQSGQLEWDAQGKDIKAREKVKVTYRGATATAEAMDYAQTAQVVEMTSPKAGDARPRIEQNGDIITGDKIILKIKERAYQARGQARADVYPKEKNTGAGFQPVKEKP
jgi:lipopolysaccharide transport protein LptA